MRLQYWRVNIELDLDTHKTYWVDIRLNAINAICDDGVDRVGQGCMCVWVGVGKCVA